MGDSSQMFMRLLNGRHSFPDPDESTNFLSKTFHTIYRSKLVLSIINEMDPDGKTKILMILKIKLRHQNGIDTQIKLNLRVDAISVSVFTRSHLTKIAAATQWNPILSTVHRLTLNGCLSRCTYVPRIARNYWNFRDKVSLEDDLLMKGEWVIIPPSCRDSIFALSRWVPTMKQGSFQQTRVPNSLPMESTMLTMNPRNWSDPSLPPHYPLKGGCNGWLPHQDNSLSSMVNSNHNQNHLSWIPFINKTHSQVGMRTKIKHNTKPLQICTSSINSPFYITELHLKLKLGFRKPFQV